MESSEKQLISAFAAAWNETAPAVLNESSMLSLLALREVSGEGMASALAVAMTWSSAFAVPCSGALGGVMICLFKSEEGAELDRLAKQPADGAPKPGGRALINATFEKAATDLSATLPAPVTFTAPLYIDLTLEESRLASIVGDTAWVGTFSLSVGDEMDTQALLLYAPHGSIEPTPELTPGETNFTSAPPTPTSENAPPATPSPASARRAASTQRRDDTMPRNIERLLDVELDVVVRFGVTNVPLRDVVRMGTGSMIELNRAVDDPVELLVNGRPLARGEVVVVDGYYGVRITEIGAPAERVKTLL